VANPGRTVASSCRMELSFRFARLVPYAQRKVGCWATTTTGPQERLAMRGRVRKLLSLRRHRHLDWNGYGWIDFLTWRDLQLNLSLVIPRAVLVIAVSAKCNRAVRGLPQAFAVSLDSSWRGWPSSFHNIPVQHRATGIHHPPSSSRRRHHCCKQRRPYHPVSRIATNSARDSSCHPLRSVLAAPFGLLEDL